MNFDLVRVLSLTIVGNGAVAGYRLRGFWTDSAIFKFEPDCIFLDKYGSVIAADPPSWMERIKGASQGLWLHNAQRNEAGLADRLGVAFAGGGPRWIIEAVRDGGSELWEAADGYETPDGKTWPTAYVRIATDWHDPLPRLIPIRGFIARFDAALEAIAEFAHDENEANWERIFRSAQNALRGRERFSRTFFAELESFTDISWDAKRILTALPSAWVFGGMGSWNDKSFSGASGERYDTLTNALYQAIMDGVVIAANSTFAQPKPRNAKSWWGRLFGR